MESGVLSHGTRDLLDYIVNRVAILQNSTFINVTADKDYFGNHRREITPFSLFIKGRQLFISETSNNDRLRFSAILDDVEICAY